MVLLIATYTPRGGETVKNGRPSEKHIKKKGKEEDVKVVRRKGRQLRQLSQVLKIKKK